MKNLTTYIFEKNLKCTCYMLIGLPGSGKSTWCKEKHPELPVVSRDIIRAELGFTKSADEKAVLNYKDEQQVTLKEQEKMKQYAESGQDFIMDDTNIKLKYRKKSIEWLHTIGVKVVGVWFDTQLDVCIKRRDGQIDKDTMKDIASKMTSPDKNEFDGFIKVKQ